MGRPVNNFSVPPEQMIRHMQYKQQMMEGFPELGAPANQATRDIGVQMPATPSTLMAMGQMESELAAREANAKNLPPPIPGAGSWNPSSAAALEVNALRNREPSMNMLPARAAQMRQEEQFRQFLRGNQ